MPKFKVTMSEPERFFPTYGHLKDGDVVTADAQPSDGVTWSWGPADKNAEPVAAEPVVPDSALPPVFAEAAEDAEPEAPVKASEPPASPENPPVTEQA